MERAYDGSVGGIKWVEHRIEWVEHRIEWVEHRIKWVEHYFYHCCEGHIILLVFIIIRLQSLLERNK